MKNLIFFISLTFLFLTNCHPSTEQTINTESTVVNTEKAKKNIQTVLEKFHLAVQTADYILMDSLLTPNGLYCGTDPGGHMDKETLLFYTRKTGTPETPQPAKYEIDVQKIRLTEGGMSAIAVEQMIMPHISPIPMCQTTYLIKKDDKWFMDFASFGFIPPNRDLHLFNKVSPEYKANTKDIKRW